MEDNKKKYFKIGIVTTVLLTLVGSIGIYNAANGGLTNDRCNHVIIKIANPENQPFILESDIEPLLTQNGSEQLEGKPLDAIDISGLERKVKRNLQVKKCEIHADLKGNLLVDVEPYLPIARILIDNTSDVYVDAEGVFFPTSKSYTARVMLLSGDYFGGLSSLRDEKSKSLLTFLQKINEEIFWKTQFSEVEVTQDFHIKIVPLFGQHIIELGTPDDMDAKLERLLVFYKKIYPVEGWDKFSRVNVSYAKQIVCE